MAQSTTLWDASLTGRAPKAASVTQAKSLSQAGPDARCEPCSEPFARYGKRVLSTSPDGAPRAIATSFSGYRCSPLTGIKRRSKNVTRNVTHKKWRVRMQKVAGHSYKKWRLNLGR